MLTDRPPEHMDRWMRNERLYRHLLEMGLVAVPIFADDERTRIDHLMVSVDLPFAQGGGEETAMARVGPPVERTEVGASGVTAEGVGNNVVEFPPVV